MASQASGGTSEDGLVRTRSYLAAVRQPTISTPGDTASTTSTTSSTSTESADSTAGLLPPSSALTRSRFNPVVTLRRYLLMWVTPLIVLGAKRQVQPNDFCRLPPRDRAASLLHRLKTAWVHECRRCGHDAQAGEGVPQERRKRPSFWRALFAAFGLQYFTLTAALLLEVASLVAQPVFVSRVLSGLLNEASSAALYRDVGILCAITLARVCVIHPIFFEAWRLGMDTRAAVIAMVYDKVLTISQQALSTITTGNVITLISNDAERFIEANVFGHFLFIGPVQGALVSWLLYREIGVSAFAGLGLVWVMIPLQLLGSRYFARLRSKTAELTDQRVKIMSEILSGMRVLKMYAWEEPFSQIIKAIRTQELRFVRRSNNVRAFNITFFLISTTVTTFLSLIVYELTGNDITVEKAFTVLALFSSTKLPLSFNFAHGIQSVSEISVVIARVRSFLLQPDVGPAAGSSPTATPALAIGSGPKVVAASDEATGRVVVDAMSCSWDGRTPTLQHIAFTVEPGQLVGVVGPVGSGKSTLMMLLLKELQTTAGVCAAGGRVVYAAQDPWIMSATFQDNILFGRPYEADRYHQVIEACQLVRDVARFTHGHHTMIGERGVTLSGGQKARLSLARCVYSKADVYLLDDPLSAVDAIVGRRLFDGCVRGFLAGKTRVLVTHQLQFAKLSDKIAVLKGDGSLEGYGSYAELQDQGHDIEHWATLGFDEPPKTGQSAAAAALPPPATATTTAAAAAAARRLDTNLGKQEVMAEEARQEGNISLRTYGQYIAAGGSVALRILLFASFILVQANLLTADWYLSYWTELGEERRDDTRNLVIYAALVGALIAFGFARSFGFTFFAFKASQTLHDLSLESVLGTSMRFFDSQPIGRILNRFAKDLGYMDDLLPHTSLDFLTQSVHAVGVTLLVIALNPILLALIGPLALVFWLLRSYYIKTAREVKRIEGVARSPVYAHVSTTLAGLATIRSYPGAPARFTESFQLKQDAHGRSYWYFVAVSRWLGIRLDLLTWVFITGTAFGAILLRGQLSAGEIGLSLALSLQLTASLQWCVRQSAEVENHMTSTERMIEYTALPQESDLFASTARDELVPASWPSEGRIAFRDLSLQYVADGPFALKGLSFEIPGGSRVGVCGRTGAGKSSLLAAMLRLGATTGSIVIDGVATDHVSLHRLRSSLGVIPQDPVLFSTTIRKNLDPFGRCSDTDIWSALEDVQLKKLVEAMPMGLSAPVTENGGNFSVGQRQLICLARAILKHAKVLIMDEATADVDQDTDTLIQRTVRTKFPDRTVITIAHRLNTIIDSDLILVLSNGEVSELGPPATLRAAPDSHFQALLTAAGM